MNEATADNNGAYLSDGRHGNGCRQRGGGRWGGVGLWLCAVLDCAAPGLCSTPLTTPPPPYPPTQLALVKRY